MLCFDLGATRLKAGVVQAGQVRDHLTRPTAGADAGRALAILKEAAGQLRTGHDVGAAGVGVPGIVDHGTVTALPGKFDGIVGMDVRMHLSGELGLPVTVVNDAVAYGAGEAAFGSGRGFGRVVVMTIGTGVGVTVLQDGSPVASGPLGAGILGGQVPISDEDGPFDTNGRQGTIEARCSAGAIVRYARDEGVPDDADVPEIYAAWHDGERAARDAVARYRRWLARAIVALAHAHTPEAVVLGGGAMPAGNPVVEGLEELVRERLWPGYSTRIALASTGDDASLLGLAHLLSPREGRG